MAKTNPDEVTAERHALDNPGHIVHVRYDAEHKALRLTCHHNIDIDREADHSNLRCGWWDVQLVE
jgi:hypothetical protein